MGKPGGDLDTYFEQQLSEVKQRPTAEQEAAAAHAAAQAAADEAAAAEAREAASSSKREEERSSRHRKDRHRDGERDRAAAAAAEPPTNGSTHRAEPDYPPAADAEPAGTENGGAAAAAGDKDEKDRSDRERRRGGDSRERSDRKRRRHREDSREGGSSRRRGDAPEEAGSSSRRGSSHRDDRDRDRERRSRRDDDRDRDRDSRRERSRERSRRHRSRSRSRSRSAGRRSGPLTAEEREAAIKQAAIDELTRDQRTVFVNQITSKVREKDLKKFFEACGGPVKNVIMLRDKATNRHRGFAYVEMRDLDAVPLVLQFSNTVPDFQKFPIMVKASEAEKNYLAKEEKAAASASASAAGGGGSPSRSGTPAAGGARAVPTIQIGNIHPNVLEEDLQAIVSQFGTVVAVTLQRDATGSSKGSAEVLYSDSEGAQLCIERLNGLDIAGKALTVAAKQEAPPAAVVAQYSAPPVPSQYSAYAPPAYAATAATSIYSQYVPPGSAAQAAAVAAAQAAAALQAAMMPQQPGGQLATANWRLDDDTGSGGVTMNSGSRAALMAKLAQGAGLAAPSPYQPPAVATDAAAAAAQAVALAQQAAAHQAALAAASAAASAAAAAATATIAPAASAVPPVGGSLSFCLLIKNMYNPAEESEEGWELDIKEDVEAECSNYGKVVHTFVEGAAPGGLVWVMFAAAPAAAASAAALNGRFFAQRMITVDYVQPTDYVSKFPETASAALQCTM